MVSVTRVHSLEEVLANREAKGWLQELGLADHTVTALDNAFQWLSEQPKQSELLSPIDSDFVRQGLLIVEILLELNMDDDSLVAALLYPFFEHQSTDNKLKEKIKKNFKVSVLNLLMGVKKMASMGLLSSRMKHSPEQAENIRRMLTAMIEDVRAVVLKLSQQIVLLREIKNSDEETRVLAAKETQNIYAPLANRLGIGQLKWELEDYAFRYLQPQMYKDIASSLEEKRTERQQYLEDFVESLTSKMTSNQIDAMVYGRPKHIYSIWKKMLKKGYEFSQLYDIRAVRVVTERLQDCYSALGVIHTNWRHIPSEFDDYVATPKPNGYQSIHTVVLGPEGKPIEIQIRTQQMHEDAELGVAAHWQYKEGAVPTKTGKGSSYEDKIAWLRKLLQWQEEMADSNDFAEELRNQVVEDRVYVFTPQGDVVDLPNGSTPLDFAYYVHTNVGHRCIGAKVFNRIVPFTYQLKTGDQIEIITGKELNPKRDWLNPNLDYVHSSRARAKVQTWFKQQDKDKNVIEGKHLLEQELSRLNIHWDEAELAKERFNMVTLDDLLAAIGGGDVKLNQVVNYIQSKNLKESPPEVDPRLIQKPRKTKTFQNGVILQGVGNLMNQLAGCCNPIPGDEISGYITQGRGVVIHRSDCEQFKVVMDDHPERFIDATWAEQYSGGYLTQIKILANDRSGLLRDVTSILANEKVNVLGMNTQSEVAKQLVWMDIKLEVYNVGAFNRVVSKIGQLDEIIEVKRV
ncbi:GTP diphosphokinase [Psychrosphaera sp. B3R10]|uniref:GTP diphosphokinase n=1 Tax=unclassified Psychrosphaera TaxID=2641570 RepID=UPI001C0A0AC4|nr:MULTISPECIES: GTP diphosphokinase [unclassified Psychrosphaera]MBU2881484.1 GTP diphosphokinase [Psychrosphaera sp. I2R16]MBU2989504.1 GTP diphosphokinase [Psychrosphaera sp. B3R10]MDO6719220.1 GTP diphosphokinase [Psychrosphaera sp. 1_MG-2023]